MLTLEWMFSHTQLLPLLLLQSYWMFEQSLHTLTIIIHCCNVPQLNWCQALLQFDWRIHYTTFVLLQLDSSI